MKTGVIILSVIVIGALMYAIAVGTRNSTNKTSNNNVTNNSATSQVPKETITLAAVGGHTGSGTASREVSASGKFEHTVDAVLNDPATSKFYEGWLVRGKMGDSNFAFFSTGKLDKDADGHWRSSFESSVNYIDYSTVVITLETLANGLDGKPEEHLLEGSF